MPGVLLMSLVHRRQAFPSLPKVLMHFLLAGSWSLACFGPLRRFLARGLGRRLRKAMRFRLAPLPRLWRRGCLRSHRNPGAKTKAKLMLRQPPVLEKLRHSARGRLECPKNSELHRAPSRAMWSGCTESPKEVEVHGRCLPAEQH